MDAEEAILKTIALLVFLGSGAIMVRLGSYMARKDRENGLVFKKCCTCGHMYPLDGACKCGVES